MNRISDVILNRQWAIVVGLLATALAYLLTEYAADIPVELVPVLAAAVTWLRVWSKASVDQAVADVTDDEGEMLIGDVDYQ